MHHADPSQGEKTIKAIGGGLGQIFGVIFRNDTCESADIALIKTFYGMKK